MQNGILNGAPLWLVLVLGFAGMSGAAFLGIKLRARVRTDPDDDATEGYLLSASLALLGLLVGFTFSMALNRYEMRRQLVVTEANAIGTTWLRAGLVEGPQGEGLRASLRQYGDKRLRLPKARDVTAAEAADAAVQAKVWEDLRAALPTMSQPLGATLMTATNEMFDAASSRRAEREARIPGLVLYVLVFSAMITAAIVGYVLGGRSGRRHWMVTALLFAMLSVAITLIFDLDRPWSGLIEVPQSPMEYAVGGMR